MISEEHFVDFTCPHCGETVSCPAAEGHLVQTCPSCYEPVLPPESPGQAGRKVPLPLTTGQLVLRRLQGGDWKDLLDIMGDEEMFRYEEMMPLDEDNILRWLESDGHVRLTTPDQPFTLAMQLREGEKVVGYVSLQFRDAQCRQGNVSVYVPAAHRDKGYALEALQATVSFCLRTLNTHRLTAFADSRDHAALELYEQAGMKREGHFRKNRMVRGEWVDTVWYGVLGADVSAAGQP